MKYYLLKTFDLNKTTDKASVCVSGSTRRHILSKVQTRKTQASEQKLAKQREMGHSQPFFMIFNFEWEK